MKFINILISFFSFTIADVIPQLPGGQKDDHNCVLDGGYQWCETLNQCVRIWETHCESLENPINNNPSHVIPKNCATWNDGCNTCEVNREGALGACTMMYCFTQNTPICTSYYINEDLCLTNSDCDSDKFCRPTSSHYNSLKECVNYANENDSCGGFTIPNMQNICNPSLECVNTFGPMIADAPGTCKRPCKNNELRDQYGNCIDNDCQVWFNGCNTCRINQNNLFCTEMFCDTPSEAHCHDNLLNDGDICYRFCEDNSEPPINRRTDCPSNSECVDANSIGFDSCGKRASICAKNEH